MSRTHEQSSSQRDHRGESSQEEVQQGVAPMDVVRQQAQRVSGSILAKSSLSLGTHSEEL